MATRAELQTHYLINKERAKRGLKPARWSPVMYDYARDQALKMARLGYTFHSYRCALNGGENVAGGRGHYSPRYFVKGWMRSPQHRAWILDPRVIIAAVGLVHSKKGCYAAWSFSS